MKAREFLAATIIYMQAKLNKDCRILLCAGSNEGVDKVACALTIMLPTEELIVIGNGLIFVDHKSLCEVQRTL